MGELEVIYPDGSGFSFGDEGIVAERYVFCDGCNTQQKVRDMKTYYIRYEMDAIWLCRKCDRTKVK